MLHQSPPLSIQPFRPLVLGVASLDAIRYPHRVGIGFGGVAKNVACALGALGESVVFVSPGHGEELDAALEQHFQASGVSWRRLPLSVPMPFYEAFIVPGGEVRRERNYDNGAFAPLKPALLRQAGASLLGGASLVLASTDLHARSLQALESLCRQAGLPFGLISSSRPKARRIRSVRPSLLALNLGELRQLFPLPQAGLAQAGLAQIAAAAAGLVEPAGVCLVTDGAAGALLVLPAAGRAIFQPVPRLSPVSTVGAGDTLLAALIGRYHRLADWPQALAEATRHTLDFLSKEALPADLLPAQRQIAWPGRPA